MKRLLINVGRHFVWAFKLSGKFVIREYIWRTSNICKNYSIFTASCKCKYRYSFSGWRENSKFASQEFKGGIKKRRRIVLQMIPISFFNLEGNLHLGGNGSICCLQICNHLVLGLNDRIAMQIVWHYKNSPTFVYWHQKKYKVGIWFTCM